MKSVPVGGVPIKFPKSLQPFPAQLALMSKVVASLKRSQNALLGSPTGTGKTLALLASTLAWQNEDFKDQQNRSKKSKITKIYFASRTHSQLTQVAEELKLHPDLLLSDVTIEKESETTTSSTNRRNVVVLGSRDHFCVNKDVRKQKSSSNNTTSTRELCEELLEADACREFKRHPQLVSSAPNVWDIEDLVKMGRKKESCPYFASRTMLSDAAIVLCPYNYILDSLIRSKMDVKIENSVVIFDEAHNICDVARSIASFDVSFDELISLETELTKYMLSCKDDELKTHCKKILNMTKGFLRWGKLVSKQIKPEDFEKEQNVWSGEEAMGILSTYCDMTSENFKSFRDAASKLTSDSAEARETRWRAKRTDVLPGHVLATMQGFVHVCELLYARNIISDDDRVRDNASHYRLVLMRSTESSTNRGRRGRRGRVEISYDSTWEYKISFWCLNASVIFEEITNSTRSVLMASGTIAPIESFASELGVPFRIRLEARHVVDVKRQVLVGWLGETSTGSSNSTSLRATYKDVSRFLYQDALGRVVSEIVRSTPNGGVLCFFASYNTLTASVNRWTSTGQLKRLRDLKRVVVEPRKSRATDKEMREFVDIVSRTSKGETENNTLFLAVCRGKLSEGIDFPGSAARAVILVGIPYPSTKDLRVKLQREYQDSMRKSSSSSSSSSSNDQETSNQKTLSGREWYTQQAFRALNQAAGRCIRHRKDWGSVIFLDSRYGNNGALRSLPRWLRPHVKRFRGVGEMCNELREFVGRNHVLFEEAAEKKKEEEEEEEKKKKEKKNVEVEETIVETRKKKMTNLLDMFRRGEEKEEDMEEKIRLTCTKCGRVFAHVKQTRDTSRVVTTNSILSKLNENNNFVAVNRLMLEENVFAPALRRDVGEMFHWWDDQDKRAYRLLCCSLCHPRGTSENAIASEVIGIGRRDDQTLGEIWMFRSKVGVLRRGERKKKSGVVVLSSNRNGKKRKKVKTKKKKTKKKKKVEEQNDESVLLIDDDDDDDDFELVVRKKKKKKAKTKKVGGSSTGIRI